MSALWEIYSMIKHFTFLVLVGLLFASPGFSQQDPQFSQHMFTKLYYNPGFAGANDAICGTLLYRNQWTGFGGEPKTAMLTADMPLDALHGGIGISVHALDKLGAGNSLNIKANYAYRADLGNGRIGIGLGLGYMQESLDGSKLIYNDDGDQNIPTGTQSGGSYDLSLGLYYNTDNLYVGLSSSHLTANELKVGDVTTKLSRHYFLMAGYSYDITSTFTIKPAVMIKSDVVETQFDVNANLFINSKYWIGGAYRFQDAIVVMAGIELIPNLKLGYAYDITTSKIKTYSSGTHEIVLGYCMNVAKVVKRQFHRNVRFL
ncbi:type IX secretion system membrane protein PorP/SprF [soil metagenome]